MQLMKKIVLNGLLASMLAISFAACTKDKTPGTINEPNPIPSGTKVSMGAFTSGVHPTSGMVKYSTDITTGKRYLVFENFKTDNGPDLRVWLATNTATAGYVEIGLLKAVSGNFFYELPATTDPAAKPYVLIWCKDFSVLFGHAVLN
jgi:Electron transfer DM13